MELRIGAGTRAPGLLAIEGFWTTLADAAAWQAWRDREGLASTPGTGPELTLVEAGGGAPAPAPADPLAAADTDPENNWSAAEVTVEGDNRPDFAAIGAELDGAAGDTVAVAVGVENVGPATADHSRSGESVNWVQVTVPVGTTAVEVPAGCSEQDGGVYLCSTGELLRAGDSELFQFVLRIDEVIADATGLVEVNRSPADPAGTPWPDPEPDNDTAKIVANPTGGAGAGCRSPAPQPGWSPVPVRCWWLWAAPACCCSGSAGSGSKPEPRRLGAHDQGGDVVVRTTTSPP